MESDPPSSLFELGLVDGLVLLSELVQSVFIQSAADHGLPALQARLLGILRGRRPTMAELGRLIDLDKSSTTGLVDRTERRGLVARVAVPEDGRSYRVELTAEGRATAKSFAASVTAELERIVALFDQDDRRRLSHLVSALVTESASANGLDFSAGLTGSRARAGSSDPH